MDAPMDPPAGRRWSTRRKLLLQLVLLPLTVVCAELLVRGWNAAAGTPYSSAQCLQELERIADQIDQPVGIFAPRDNQDELTDEDRRRIQN
ncbi:MAG TPA: hypothetical protein VKB65_01950, partial [Myxococcota bacterium]|nr:hypothetical protein [Myxococcota bacterium]